MGGHGGTVQIDESLFQGERKYNRGRLQCGDHQPFRQINRSHIGPLPFFHYSIPVNVL